MTDQIAEALQHFEAAGIPNRDDADVIAGQALAAEVRHLRAQMDIRDQLLNDRHLMQTQWMAAQAKLARVEVAGRDAVDMYDRYCLHDMTIDEHDLGKTLEALRGALKDEP